MESRSSNKFASRVERELSTLKLVSRLLGHELHNQSGQRVQFSREAVVEIQTAVDLFIEKIMQARSNTPLTTVETAPVEAGAVDPRALSTARDADGVGARMN